MGCLYWLPLHHNFDTNTPHRVGDPVCIQHSRPWRHIANGSCAHNPYKWPKIWTPSIHPCLCKGCTCIHGKIGRHYCTRSMGNVRSCPCLAVPHPNPPHRHSGPNCRTLLSHHHSPVAPALRTCFDIHRSSVQLAPTIGENRQLVTDEPGEFKKKNRLNFQDCRKFTDRFRGVYRIYPNLIKGKPEDANM